MWNEAPFEFQGMTRQQLFDEIVVLNPAASLLLFTDQENILKYIEGQMSHNQCFVLNL